MSWRTAGIVLSAIAGLAAAVALAVFASDLTSQRVGLEGESPAAGKRLVAPVRTLARPRPRPAKRRPARTSTSPNPGPGPTPAPAPVTPTVSDDNSGHGGGGDSGRNGSSGHGGGSDDRSGGDD